jgi:hypothetical protein
MKTKIVIAALVCALITNVASAAKQDTGFKLGGTIGAGYVSDDFFRGQASSGESLQANVGFNTSVGSVGLFADLATTQSVDSTEADTNDVTVGLSLTPVSKIDLLLGVYNTDISNSGGNLEGFVGVQIDTLLNPSITVYRNTSEELYTYEGQLSHSIDLDVFDLQVSGWLGNTELTTSDDSTYYGAKLAAVKSLGNIDLYADVAVDDNKDRDAETLWGAGVAVKF